MKDDKNNDSLFPVDMSLEGFSDEEVKKIKEINEQYRSLKDSGELEPEVEKELNNATQRMLMELQNKSTELGGDGRTHASRQADDEQRRMMIIRMIEMISDFIRKVFKAMIGRREGEQSRNGQGQSQGHGMGFAPQGGQQPPMEAKRTGGFKKDLTERMGGLAQHLAGLSEKSDGAIKSAFNKGAGITPPSGLAADILSDQQNGLNVAAFSASPKGAGAKGGMFSKNSANQDMGQYDDDEFDPSDFDYYHDEGTDIYHAIQPNGLMLSVSAQEVLDDVKRGIKERRSFQYDLEGKEVIDMEFLEVDNPTVAPPLALGMNPEKPTSKEQPNSEYYIERKKLLEYKTKEKLWAAQQISLMSYNKELMSKLAKPALEGDKEAFEEEAIYGAYKQLEGAKETAIQKVADALVQKGERASPFLALAYSANLASEEGVESIRQLESVKRAEKGANGEPDHDLSATIEEVHLAAKGAQDIQKMEPDSAVMYYVNDRIREDEARDRVAKKQAQAQLAPMLKETPNSQWESEFAFEQQALYRERRKAMDSLKKTWDECVQDDPRLDSRYFEEMINNVGRENNYAKLMELVNNNIVMDVMHEKNPDAAKAVLNVVQANIAMGQLNQSQPNMPIKGANELLKSVQSENNQHSEQILTLRATQQPVTDRNLIHSKQQEDLKDFLRDFMEHIGQSEAYKEQEQQKRINTRQRMA